MNISATTEPTAASTGQYFKTAAAVGAANKGHTVQIDSGVTSGVLTEATSVKLTFNQDDVNTFVLGVNGQSSTANSFNFDSDTFASSAFKTSLDNLMANLNVEYLGSPFSYSMDVANRAITITNSKGGEIFFDGHTTNSTDLELQLDVMSGVLQNASDTSGPGDAVIKANEAVTVASATGDGSVETTTSTSTSSSSYTSGHTGIDQLTIATQAGANSALGSIDAALATILSERAKLGALENRLDHTVNNLSNVATNTTAAQGRIMDADFARETTNLTKSQILSQAATSMLAQANQSKQNILALLQ
jgi:flagellin